MIIDADFTNTSGLKATANRPAEATSAPFRVAINRQKPIRGRVFADGEVKLLWGTCWWAASGSWRVTCGWMGPWAGP